MPQPAIFAPGFLVALLLICAGAAPLRAATNDLRILSLLPDTNGYAVLTWTSHPGECYTVYWTDALEPNPFWRVAAVNVPSGGTNTTWSEAAGPFGGQMKMSLTAGQLAAAAAKPALSEEELAKRPRSARRPAGPSWRR